MDTYKILMHKDTQVAEIQFSEMIPVRIREIYDASLMPIGTDRTAELFNRWLSNRMMPNDRPGVKDILSQTNTKSTVSFAGFSRAVSLLDCYWFADRKELDNGLSWSNVNSWLGESWTKSGQAFFAGKMKYVNDINSPDFCTPGTAPKTWAIEDDGIYLLKKDTRNKWTSFSEIAASQTAELLKFRYVPHFFSVTNRELCVGSPCILQETGDRCELVGLWQLIPENSGFEDIEAFIDEYHLIENYAEMIVLDYLTGNTKRTLHDILLIRDSSTLDLYGIAPYFACSEGYLCSLNNEPLISSLTNNMLRDDMKRLIGSTSFKNIDIDALKNLLTQIGNELMIEETKLNIVIQEALERAEICNKTKNTP